MNTNKRLLAASAAAVAGLFLAGCDNTETEETPETPAQTRAPLDESPGDDIEGPDTETGGVNDGGADGQEGTG